MFTNQVEFSKWGIFQYAMLLIAVQIPAIRDLCRELPAQHLSACVNDPINPSDN
jgi:hypothetical protein